ncbi:MAG TPA: hypothetical protein VIY49_27555 [Bryobacteraceae bacterium]
MKRSLGGPAWLHLRRTRGFQEEWQPASELDSHDGAVVELLQLGEKIPYSLFQLEVVLIRALVFAASLMQMRGPHNPRRLSSKWLSLSNFKILDAAELGFSHGLHQPKLGRPQIAGRSND